jgi:hypothetical protein
MGGFSGVHDGGAYVRSARSLGNQTATAAGAGDNTEVNGGWVSRASSRGIAQSAKLIINYTTTLAAAATLKFAVNFQDAVDVSGTGAADYPANGEAIAFTTAATGGTGGSTETGTFEVDVDLGGAREFIRAQITPDLSAGGTDTLAWSATYLFFGDQRGPTTKSPGHLGSPDLV